MHTLRCWQVFQSIGQIYRDERALAVLDWVPAHGSGTTLEILAEVHTVTSAFVRL